MNVWIQRFASCGLLLILRLLSLSFCLWLFQTITNESLFSYINFSKFSPWLKTGESTATRNLEVLGNLHVGCNTDMEVTSLVRRSLTGCFPVLPVSSPVEQGYFNRKKCESKGGHFNLFIVNYFTTKYFSKEKKCPLRVYSIR